MHITGGVSQVNQISKPVLEAHWVDCTAVLWNLAKVPGIGPYSW